MTTVAFDTLKFASRLEAGGFTPQQARAAAEAFADATGQELATKTDLARVEAKIAAVEASLKADTARVEAGLKADIATLRGEVQAGFRDVEQRMTIKLGGIAVVAVGVLLAAMRFFAHG